MKRFLSLILCLCAFLSAFTISSYAEGREYDWFYKRRGEGAPEFPEEASLVKEHNGIYIDLSAYEKGEKKLYITFDAGYENGNVAKILDILKQENVPAAFFVLSNFVVKNKDLLQRMKEEGHLVCNHTKNHKNMCTLTDEEMAANLRTLEEQYFEATGENMAKFFRFPEGHYDERTLGVAEKMGYKTVFWSLSYADWDNNAKYNVNKILERLSENTHNGAILLFHPTSEINLTVLPEMIKRWKSEGYAFGTLTDIEL